MALNVAMNLQPFDRIDACGYAGLRTVDLRSLGVAVAPALVAQQLAARLQQRLQR